MDFDEHYSAFSCHSKDCAAAAAAAHKTSVVNSALKYCAFDVFFVDSGELVGASVGLHWASGGRDV